MKTPMDFIIDMGFGFSPKIDEQIVQIMEEYAQQQVKNLNIPAVINQRELLIDFLMAVDEVYGMHVREDAEKCADDYLKSINSL